MKTMFYFWFFGPVIEDSVSGINASGIFDAFFEVIPYIPLITLCCFVITKLIKYFLNKYFEKNGE